MGSSIINRVKKNSISIEIYDKHLDKSSPNSWVNYLFGKGTFFINQI